MKRLWLFLILPILMLGLTAYSQAPTTTDQAKQQIVQATDWLIGQIGQVQTLTAERDRLKTENATLTANLAKATADLAKATTDQTAMKALLADILKYFQMPASFIQRLQQLGVTAPN